MEAFRYCCPTEVVFGRDTELSTADCVKNYCGSRVFIVYGGGSVVRSGLLDRVCNNLKEAGIAYETFGGAQANPTLEHAREGVEKSIAFGSDFILGIGGGSAIDTAKAIAHGTKTPETDIWQYWIRKQPVTASLPVGVILTISAAGSETSNSSVLTNVATGQKRGLATEFNRPKFAIMNPELTFTLPPYQVACGVTDIMMHTMDRYFNLTENEMTDSIAEALLRTVIASGRIAVKDPHDYTSMSELMWAGSLSHNGLTGLGGPGDWSVHQLGHELSGKFGTAHGASLATMWDTWASYVYQQKPSRFARYARNVWGMTGDDDQELALAAIQATKEYFRSIGMPTSFSENKEVGIQSEEIISELAYRCAFEGTRTIGSFRVLKEEDICQVYANANR